MDARHNFRSFRVIAYSSGGLFEGTKSPNPIVDKDIKEKYKESKNDHPFRDDLERD